MSSRNELYDKVVSDIKDRNRWEQRQSLWYEMRHYGLRRKNKPWNNASDLHFPLADSVIERLKPFYYMQIVGMDTIASFVPMRQQDGGLTVTAERWFDYQMKERTNFLTESLTWIDNCLMSGRAVIKVYWDEKRKRAMYDSIDPMMIVVPDKTKNLQDAERIVHIMQMTTESFAKNPMYAGVDIDLVQTKRVAINSNDREDKIFRREGLNNNSDKSKIIVWEVYQREGDKIKVESFCPEIPEMNLRPPMELDYNHGEFPFVDFSYEVKDKGWFSPRGVCEIVGPFEASLCKMWNEKHDAMTLFNRPMFKTDRDIPNSSNLRLSPAQILPVGIAPVPMSQPPISWDTEINMTRVIAEQRIGMPDFGAQSMYDNKGDRRTATEINAITGLMAESNDLRARVFRLSLGDVYRQTWELYLQYNKEELEFRYREDTGQIDPEAFFGDYVIEPKGGPDSQNRGLKLQQAMQRKQLFAGSPFINQAELDRSILELDDPSLVRRMFLDPQMRQQHEALEEANNISIIETGFPVPVKGNEQFELRIGVLVQYLDNKMGDGEEVSERTQQLIVQRIQELLSAYEQVDPQGAKLLSQSLAQSAASLMQDRQAMATETQDGQQGVPAEVLPS